MNRTSQTCGISRVATYMYRNPRKRGERQRAKKKYLRKYWLKIQLDGKHYPTDSEVQIILTRINTKRSIPRHIILTFLKAKDKEKILKSSKRKMANHVQGKRNRIDYKKQGAQKAVGRYIQSAKRKKKQTCSQKFSNQNIILQKQRQTFPNK